MSILRLRGRAPAYARVRIAAPIAVFVGVLSIGLPSAQSRATQTDAPRPQIWALALGDAAAVRALAALPPGSVRRAGINTLVFDPSTLSRADVDRVRATARVLSATVLQA